MLKNKKAVIFDLDGTLADSMWVWSEIDHEFFSERGITFPASLNHEIEGLGFTETAVYFTEHFPIRESVDEIKEIWTNMAIDKYRHKTPLKPGALELLQYLALHQIKIGIATSNSRQLAEIFLDSHRITPYIDAITTSCEVKGGKPQPDVYLATADKLCVSPADCLVFEDIPMGILAAKNAGMTVCAVEDEYSRDLREEKLRLSDYYIENFREII